MATKEQLEAVRAQAIENGFYSPVPPDNRWINQIGLPTGIRDLGKNWDGYGADPIAPALLEKIGYTVVVPGGDGSVQFEFRSGGVEVEVGFNKDGIIEYVGVTGEVQVDRF